jgi:hypothetical protein
MKWRLIIEIDDVTDGDQEDIEQEVEFHLAGVDIIQIEQVKETP